MKAIRRFTVRPALPPALDALGALTSNLRWSWHEPTKRLFRDIGGELWESTGHDPIALLGAVGADRLRQLAEDRAVVERVNGLRADLEVSLTDDRWYQSLGGDAPATVAYLASDLALPGLMPHAVDGLGVVAGDHVKAASDLGVPLVAVGLFSRSGSRAPDAAGLALRLLRNADHTPVMITLAMPAGGALSARVWCADVGRVPLLLLDADIPENTAELRSITVMPRHFDAEHRLRRDLLLGIGGVRALEVWSDLTDRAFPAVFHGTGPGAGFAGLERLSALIGQGLGFDEAVELVRAGTLATQHPAFVVGETRYERDLVAGYLAGGDLLPGVEAAQALALGEETSAVDVDAGAPASVFDSALLAVRLAQRVNGVSATRDGVLGRVVRTLWPRFEPDEVPIGWVMNGVHAASWTDARLVALAEERLGAGDTTGIEWRPEAVGDADLWEVRRALRQALVDGVRRRERAWWEARNRGSARPAWMDEMLDPAALTLGLVRRSSSFRALELLLRDPDRLTRLLTDPDRPVQLVVAGGPTAAGDDVAGGVPGELVKRVTDLAHDARLRGRIAVLGDDDMLAAQALYPGVDVWVQVDPKPLESGGTTGMKAALNGSLNVSTLDGWWDDYFDGINGWAVEAVPVGAIHVGAVPVGPGPGPGPGDDDDAREVDAERDRLDSDALFDVLEGEVLPEFFDRPDGVIPPAWMARVRHTLSHLPAELSAERMVRDYVERFYLPAARSHRALATDGFRPARDLAAWKGRLRAAWPGVAIGHVESGGLDHVPQVGDVLRLRARVRTAGLTPGNVTVQVVYGAAGANGELTATHTAELAVAASGNALGTAATTGVAGSSDETVFEGEVRLVHAGGFGYTVRVVPRHPLLSDAAEPGLVAVAGQRPDDDRPDDDWPDGDRPGSGLAGSTLADDGRANTGRADVHRAGAAWADPETGADPAGATTPDGTASRGPVDDTSGS